MEAHYRAFKRVQEFVELVTHLEQNVSELESRAKKLKADIGVLESRKAEAERTYEASVSELQKKYREMERNLADDFNKAEAELEAKRVRLVEDIEALDEHYRKKKAETDKLIREFQVKTEEAEQRLVTAQALVDAKTKELERLLRELRE